MTFLALVRYDSGSIQIEETTIRRLGDWQTVLAQTIEFFANDRNVVEIKPFRIVRHTGQIIREF